MASEAAMATRMEQPPITLQILYACLQSQLQQLQHEKLYGLPKALMELVKIARLLKQFQPPNIFLGWKLARRATKHISKLELRHSSMVACGINSCRGVYQNVYRVSAMLIRNSAAQAWNRSDSRAAKALSLRGQSENNLMREAHREAARILYEERNKDADSSRELYVDLHGKSNCSALCINAQSHY
jgi:hypothetical protein